RPSTADDAFTKKVKEAARLMDIRVLDHLIVCDDCYFSYADEGKI
ncbi:MAG: JAB domain-containing protein, partial [Bacteroidales bacterium]